MLCHPYPLSHVKAHDIALPEEGCFLLLDLIPLELTYLYQ
ncbi:hypothetical protein ES705_02053 [subsurface metagenome]